MKQLQREALAADGVNVVRQWGGAFPDADVDGIADLFAADATFFGTNGRKLVTEPEGIRSYFERALLQNRPRGAELLEHTAVVLSDTVVLVTGRDAVTGVKDGTPYRSEGRVSFILASRDGAWKIVHLHRSALPD